MAREAIQVALRVPPDMKEWLDDQAKRNLRSIGNEAVLAIREKMERTSAPVATNE